MPGYLTGGSGAFSTTITTTLNTSGVDRFLLIHSVASSSAGISVYLDAGATTRVLANFTPVPANETRDFGPYFIDDTYSLRGGTDVPLGHYYIDEERP